MAVRGLYQKSILLYELLYPAACWQCFCVGPVVHKTSQRAADQITLPTPDWLGREGWSGRISVNSDSLAKPCSPRLAGCPDDLQSDITWKLRHETKNRSTSPEQTRCTGRNTFFHSIHRFHFNLSRKQLTESFKKSFQNKRLRWSINTIFSFFASRFTNSKPHKISLSVTSWWRHHS